MSDRWVRIFVGWIFGVARLGRRLRMSVGHISCLVERRVDNDVFDRRRGPVAREVVRRWSRIRGVSIFIRKLYGSTGENNIVANRLRIAGVDCSKRTGIIVALFVRRSKTLDVSTNFLHEGTSIVLDRINEPLTGRRHSRACRSRRSQRLRRSIGDVVADGSLLSRFVLLVRRFTVIMWNA